MVKDYKHIHHLDWDEDYDDSDGGYSDFRVSEEEEDDEDNSRDREERAYMNSSIKFVFIWTADSFLMFN